MSTTHAAESPLSIHEPYPGLRPFLDHEYRLLRGRTDPIRQVIERLERTSFVAIIGGSGSGKSSLIRAGVVPLLRANAVEKAGDYWIPVVFTPGTATSAGSSPSQAETPVTRLAWKFSQVLHASAQPTGPDDANEPRPPPLPLPDEITAFLRQGAGFNRMTDAYHHLLPRQRPKTEKARFLFVIDQFEELFHPSNRDSADARTIVEAVVEHFHKPNERTFVVMTMRSEHLADCAGFLHLPDAINRSFYLVRRHSSEELRQVITEPAQVFLSERKRTDPSRTDPVEFAPAVVARLLSDANQIENDADHLPLLQHLLARLWSAALVREGLPKRDAVPRRITMEDLEAAVAPALLGQATAPAPGWLAEIRERKINTLRASLENWPEHLYLARGEDQRARLDQLLRRLAFRDPNNGMHFQQRVDVDDPKLLAGVSKPRELLWNMLCPGFVDEVNYLFWDDENPEHVTLKVSHEAFIRGWPRFRRLIDQEAERFDEFLATVRRCALWHDRGRHEDGLLEANELQRITAARLDPVIADDAQLLDWLGTLHLYRGSDRLRAAETALQAFVAQSQARQKRIEEQKAARVLAEQQREEALRAEEERVRIAEAHAKANAEVFEAQRRRDEAEQAQLLDRAARMSEVNRRQRYGIVFAVVVGLLLLGFYGYWLRILNPVAQTLGAFAKAQAEVAKRPLSDGIPKEGAAADELKVLRDAAARLAKARQDMQAWSLLSPRSIDAQFQLVESASTDFRVNEELYRLLTTAPWGPGPNKAADPGRPPPLPRNQSCAAPVGSPESASRGHTALRGTIVRVEGAPYGLFVSDATSGPALIVYSASFQGDACSLVREVISFPRMLWPALLFGSTATVAGIVNRANPGKSLVLYDIMWSWETQSGAMTAQFAQRRQITSAKAQPVYDLVGTDWATEIYQLPTQPVPAGMRVVLNDKGEGEPWTLLSANAQPLTVPDLRKEWVKLELQERGQGLCAQQADILERQVIAALAEFSYTAKALRDPRKDLCLVVQTLDRRKPEKGALVLPTTEVTVGLYYESALEAAYGRFGKQEPAFPVVPAASALFTKQPPAVQWTWWLGSKGERIGWLAAQPTAHADQVPQLAGNAVLAMPLDMQALVNQAEEVLADAKGSASTSSAPAHPTPASPTRTESPR